MDIEKYEDFVPLSYLKVLSDHYCTLIAVYIFLWENRDKEGCYYVLKKEIGKKTLFKRETFIDALRKICREGLCEIAEGEKSLKITLIEWTDLEDDE